MELLFVKDDKGLVANKSGKFYFPDRRSDIKEEGVYTCEVTVDKENYAFVNGYKTTTQMPEEDVLRENIHNVTFEKNPIKRLDSFSIRKIGDSLVIYKTNNDHVEIGCIRAGIGYVLLRAYEENYRRDGQISSLYKEAKFEMSEEFMQLKSSIIAESMVEINDENKMGILAQMYCHATNGFYKAENIKTIKVYDDKFVRIETNWYGNYECKIYAYSETFGVMDLDICDLPNNFGEIGIVDINVKDIVDWMVENHVGIGGWANQRLYTKSVSFMGETIDVTYIDGMKNIAEVKEEEKAKVAESFAAFEAFRKRMGKYANKSNMHEFHAISPKAILEL